MCVCLLGYPLNEDDVSDAAEAHALSSKAKIAQGLAPQSRPVTSEGLADTDPRLSSQYQSDALPIPYTTATPSFAHSHSKGSLTHMKASFSATGLRNSGSVLRLGLGQIREETAETNNRYDTRDASPVVLEQSLPSNSHYITSKQYPSLHPFSSHSTAPIAPGPSSSSQSHSTRLSHWRKEDVFIAVSIRLELLSTHGDDTYIGLTGIELLGLASSSHSNSELRLVPIKLYEGNIETEPSDLSALGFYDDPRLPKNLISGVNNTTNGKSFTILIHYCAHMYYVMCRF